MKRAATMALGLLAMASVGMSTDSSFTKSTGGGLGKVRKSVLNKKQVKVRNKNKQAKISRKKNR